MQAIVLQTHNFRLAITIQSCQIHNASARLCRLADAPHSNGAAHDVLPGDEIEDNDDTFHDAVSSEGSAGVMGEAGTAPQLQGGEPGTADLAEEGEGADQAGGKKKKKKKKKTGRWEHWKLSDHCIACGFVRNFVKISTAGAGCHSSKEFCNKIFTVQEALQQLFRHLH